jgi:ABC-2 type transport system ATP-binding protein
VNLGQKILDGTVGDIKQQFKENKFGIRLAEVPSSVESNVFTVVEQQANNLTVKINEGFKSNDVLKHFLHQNLNIEAYNEILPSLNEIFINLVEGTKATTRAFQPVND